MSFEPEIDVRCVAGPERKQAVQFLVRHCLGLAGREQQFESPHVTIWSAFENGRLVGATWLRESMPGILNAWPPVIDGVQAAAELGLAAVVDAHLTSRPYRWARLTIADLDSHQAVAHAMGFQPYTTISTLYWTPSPQPPSRGLPVLTLRPVLACNDSHFADLLQQTYVDSLDCPDLVKHLDSHDVLRAYRGCDGCTTRCLEAWDDATLVGAAVVAVDEDEQGMELVYMGILPSLRGGKLGQRTLATIQQQVRQMRIPQLTTTVDVRNVPATSCYRSMGMRNWSHQELFVRFGCYGLESQKASAAC